jgi:DNA repair protein RadA/Sms
VPRKSSAERAGSVYLCSACGNESPKWFGRCPHCGEWNTAVEESRARPAAAAAARGYAGPGEKPLRLDEISGDGLEERWPTGIGELDRVLGGGLVPGSLVLIGGDPGIGKSTLALELAAALGGSGRSVLYVSGEESPRQAKMRAERIALRRGLDHLWVQSEIELDSILRQVDSLKPALLVIDSIQTLHLGSLEGAPGSVSQVRECGLRLLRLAKDRGLPVLLIGHVTKDGAVAGPRTLEHMVDAVLYLEGDAQHGYRILSAAKNRFGGTNEIGVFEMRGDGLIEVANPSERLLRDRAAVAPGSVVVAAMEGTRPLLTEVQALVAPTHFANPQRVAQGIDGKRLAVLLAVLEKRARLSLSGCDVFVSVAGGIRLEEPAADLGVALALASSFRDAALPADWVAIGEVGLAGELRPVPQLVQRLKEAARLGFLTAVVPKSRMEEPGPKEAPPIALAAAGSLAEAIDAALPKRPAEPRRPAAGPGRAAPPSPGGKDRA